jgi:site-specific DNA-methyltransferase (adenine-specific)
MIRHKILDPPHNETIQSRDKERPHPATFPVALVEQCIRIHGKGAATRLLDPFLGIGTSAVAAQRQKIAAFTGIELDSHYLATARERVAAQNTVFGQAQQEQW